MVVLPHIKLLIFQNCKVVTKKEWFKLKEINLSYLHILISLFDKTIIVKLMFRLKYKNDIVSIFYVPVVRNLTPTPLPPTHHPN